MSMFARTALDQQNRRVEWLVKTLFLMMTVLLIVRVQQVRPSIACARRWWRQPISRKALVGKVEAGSANAPFSIEHVDAWVYHLRAAAGHAGAS